MKTIRFITQLFTQNTMLLLAACLMGLGACAGTGVSGSADSEAALMQKFTNYKAAWDRHDASAVAGFYGSNGILNEPGAGALSGPALAGWVQGLFTAIPDFKVEVKSANATGQNIASQVILKGTWTQPFPGGPLAGAKPTGKAFTVPSSGFYEWQDGKIMTATLYYDQMSMLTQMGVIPQK